MVKRLSAPCCKNQLKQHDPLQYQLPLIFGSHRDMTRFSEGGCHELELEELSETVCTYHAKWQIVLKVGTDALSSLSSL